MDQDTRRTPEPYEGGEGCLTTLIRIPVRIVVLVLVLPVRMVRDLTVAGLRILDRALLRPLGRALEWLYDTVFAPAGRALALLAHAVLVRPWTALWRHVLVPVVRHGLVGPLVWLYGAVLTPAGHGLRWAYRRVLVPIGRAGAAAVVGLFTVLLVWPAVVLWRHVLKPSGAALDLLVTYLVVLPVAWTYRRALTPAGHGFLWALLGLGRGIAATGRGLVFGRRAGHLGLPRRVHARRPLRTRHGLGAHRTGRPGGGARGPESGGRGPRRRAHGAPGRMARAGGTAAGRRGAGTRRVRCAYPG
ncbi:hypothetical protein ACFWVP_01865 [Streptomyces sp. NPDC058637]|uniref:hypothetical protein n=1 Tax=Streptomyces sp. NPDC058637 TaxID=3346569 RepID=UPI0036638A98